MASSVAASSESFEMCGSVDAVPAGDPLLRLEENDGRVAAA